MLKRCIVILFLLITSLFAAGKQSEEVKIGFVVKSVQEPWFLDEWKYAQEAADELGFTLVKLGGTSAEELLTALDNLGAQQAQGVISAVVDVRLGSAVIARAQANGLKFMSVDDRLLDTDGQPMVDVPHMGISAFNIGKQVGSAIADEITERGWDMKDVYAVRISFDELPTAKSRTDGATEALLARGVLAENILDAPQKVTDTEAAFNAANIVIAKTPAATKWVTFGVNDEATIGAVRALEGNGFDADSIIGVGIGGAASGLDEFRKSEPTGFFGTVMISPKLHGYQTAVNMYNWIVNDQEPEKLILTEGKLATRDNYQMVLEEMGLS